MDTTNKYVSCVIMGGLGNQLFQIFTVFGFALKNGWTPIFPYSEKTHLGLQRNTYWKSFLKEFQDLQISEKIFGKHMKRLKNKKKEIESVITANLTK